MTLSVAQWSYNGVLVGPGGNAGYTALDGLVSQPNVRNGDVSRPGGEGMLAGYDYLGDRTITATMSLLANSAGTFRENLAAVRAAFVKSTSIGGGVNPSLTNALVFNLGEADEGDPGFNRMVTARVREFDIPVDPSFMLGYATATAQLDSVDPTIYDAELQEATVGLTVAPGGWTFPWTFPWTFASSTGGFIFATNAGDVPCRPIVTITGPCQNPRVEQETTGQVLQFNTTLSSSDTLVVDCWAGTAILNGTVGRLNAFAPGSQFLSIPSGDNTLGFFSSDAEATAAELTVQWRNAWA